jgi:antitoxin component YwqK of YwqJK toxin-antitoxin module
MKKIIKSSVIYFGILILILFFPFKKKLYYNNGILMQRYSYILFYGSKIHGKNYEYDKNGNLYCVQNYRRGKLNGDSKYYYKNLSIKCIISFKNDKPIDIKEYYAFDGSKLNNVYLKNGNGYLKIFNDDGSITSEGSVLNGLREGIWKSYRGGDTTKINFHHYRAGIDEHGFYWQILF